MLPQIDDALLSVLVAGAIGLFIGIVLSTWLRVSRPGRPNDAGPPVRLRDGAVEAGAARAPHRFAAPAWPRPTKDRSPPVTDLLLVDDSAVARAKLRKLFEQAGYSVQLARDGVEALALLGAGDYQMMITDLEMPNMDGATLIERCRQQGRTARMPILAVTGHENLRSKFNQCRNINGVHRKPWVDGILLSHVAALVGTRTAAAGQAAAPSSAGADPHRVPLAHA